MRQAIAGALALAAGLVLASGTARAADVDVGVSIGISQPGVYGRIDIGRFPQPAVVVQRPVIIARPAVVAPPQPVYLWVPPGHQRHWRQHCGRYNACGVPVYFVQERWYREHVAPAGRHGPAREAGRGRSDDGRGDRFDRRDQRHDDRRDERGPARGHRD